MSDIRKILFSPYSNIYGIIGIVFLIGFLAWVLLDVALAPDFISKEKISGIVVAVKEPANKNANYTVPYLTIKLPDKTLIKINFHGNITPGHGMQPPTIGEAVPLNLHLYENNTKKYSINYKAWVLKKRGY